MLEHFVAYVEREWHVLRGAPFAFVTLAVLSIVLGFGGGMLYYSGQVGALHEQISAKDAQLGRYRVALGVDPGSKGALIELNNDELRAKAEHTANIIRNICLEYSKSSLALEKQMNAHGVKGEKRNEMWKPLATQFAARFDKEVKADFMNLDTELRARLGLMAMGNRAVILAPELPFNLESLVFSGEWESLFLCKYADELDQMSHLLTSDAIKK